MKLWFYRTHTLCMITLNWSRTVIVQAFFFIFFFFFFWTKQKWWNVLFDFLKCSKSDFMFNWSEFIIPWYVIRNRLSYAYILTLLLSDVINIGWNRFIDLAAYTLYIFSFKSDEQAGVFFSLEDFQFYLEEGSIF